MLRQKHTLPLLIILINLVLVFPLLVLLFKNMPVMAATGTLDISTSSVSDTGIATGLRFTDKANALYYFDPSSTLTTSLISTWHLEESSGSRTDGYGSNTLTDNNTVTSGTGKIATAGQFTAANSEYLNISDNVDLSMNNTNFTIAAWVYADSLDSDNIKGIIEKDDSVAGTRDYRVYYNYSTGKFAFGVFNSSNQNTEVEDTTTLSTNTWYLIIAWHDDTNNTLNIQVNNNTATSLSYTSDVKDSAAKLWIGTQGAVPLTFWNGRIDEVAIWKKVLTSAERTFLYNGGNGQAIGAFLTTAGKAGIGTTSPLSRLHVATDTTALTGKSALIVDQLESQDIFTASASGTTKFVIDNSGNVGIGKTPASALDVSGTLNATVYNFTLESKTAECTSASCVATATCTTGYTYLIGFRSTNSAACDTNPSSCTAYCQGPGTNNCTVTSTANNAASVRIVCGLTN